MEAGFVLLMIAMVFIGVVVGVFIERHKTDTKRSNGILNVDYSDPVDGPYMFLKLTVPIEDVVSSKRVIFDVEVTQYVSQK